MKIIMLSEIHVTHLNLAIVKKHQVQILKAKAIKQQILALKQIWCDSIYFFIFEIYI
jgi:hypothetical protein